MGRGGPLLHVGADARTTSRLGSMLQDLYSV
jgi:hypothetical protein